jgi:ATP-dependent DNA helicase RecG
MAMSFPTAMRLTTSIADVPGVSPRQAAAFRRLGVRCVADLVLHLPLRYERELAEQPIAEAARAAANPDWVVSVRGQVAAVRNVAGRPRRVEATVQDRSGSLRATWFNMPWLADRLMPGLTVRLTGRARPFGTQLTMANPRLEMIDPEAPAASPPRGERQRPVYPATEDLASWQIERSVDAVLDLALAQITDHLPEDYRRARELPALADAYRMMHRPATEEEPLQGRRRLALDELLLLQIGVMLKRRHRRETLRAPPLKWNDAIDRHIVARFPFELTASQRGVIGEIAADLQQATPMNRLVQGDVGAGKTIVALYAMLMAAASGHQAALMAPTELLAEQHHASIGAMLAGSNVRLELLTGHMPAGERRGALDRLSRGEIDLLVGTHALLTERVRFHSLAAVVIDEQHRFGVHQRATLRAKAGEPDSMPHVLVMTATPIPRTLSLTVFGDLDVSTIRGLPPGRKPIATRVLPADRAGEAYEYAAGRIARGEQAYVVVPAIEEGEADLKDVATHLEALRQGHFRGLRLAALHGRLPRAEREEIMGRFRARALDVLVATTVIEVGVDVPDASIMIIEHAERFGLAQLHQLRGRIGRASRASLCVMIADAATPEAQARLDAVAATGDGFVIAEKDLEIRGPGELFGARQSGIAPFRVARLPRDTDLLRLARRDAIAWVKANPTLAGPRDALLRERLLKAHGKALGLGDVA